MEKKKVKNEEKERKNKYRRRLDRKKEENCEKEIIKEKKWKGK